MRTCILAALIASHLGGCALQPKYGNFVANQHEITTVLIDDTIRQLESLYPPANTKFSLGQRIAKKDMFGTGLVEALRREGYAVQEYQDQQQIPDGTALNYVIDNPVKGDQGLYRIKLLAGNDLLSRAYIEDGKGILAPAGAWARMEGYQ